MSKLVQAFPQVRLAIYGIASATLAGLVIAGVVTEGQSSNILNYVGLGLGALATLLAGLNVTKPVALSPNATDIGDLTAMIPGVQPATGHVLPGVKETINQGIEAFNQAQAEFIPTVDQIRAQLEQQLGRRTEG